MNRLTFFSFHSSRFAVSCSNSCVVITQTRSVGWVSFYLQCFRHRLFFLSVPGCLFNTVSTYLEIFLFASLEIYTSSIHLVNFFVIFSLATQRSTTNCSLGSLALTEVDSFFWTTFLLVVIHSFTKINISMTFEMVFHCFALVRHCTVQL